VNWRGFGVDDVEELRKGSFTGRTKEELESFVFGHFIRIVEFVREEAVFDGFVEDSRVFFGVVDDEMRLDSRHFERGGGGGGGLN